jgi:cytochrome c553
MIGRALHVLVRAVLVTIGVATVIWSAPESAPAGPDGESSWFRFLKRWAFRAAILGALAGIAGAVVVVSGVVPVKASSGHWGITEAFLQFAKRRSVSMHTLTVDVPDLNDGRLVMMGAGHFDFGCRPCHGSPALAQPTIAARMLPQPPDLRESVARYDPAELFYIVKHGVKLTGMPAWPTLRRDDEVWAMVAFLRRLPELDAHRYRELAGTLTGAARTPNSVVPLEDLVIPEDPPPAVVENCARCHGTDGLGRGSGAFPRLAGQRPAYLLASIKAYARGERHSGIMGPVAAGLDGTSMQQIATYYASRQTASPDGSEPTPSDVEAGRAIATNGLPERLVPPCAECHGPGATRRNPVYPVLAGQYAEYLAQQLSLFKAGQRGGTEYHHIMYKVAGQLTDDQIRAVAAYYASLGR